MRIKKTPEGYKNSWQMADALFNEKARWNPDEILDSATEKQDIFKQMAISMLASDLFAEGCKHNAVKCTTYLLNKAPALMNMQVSQHDNKLPLYIALLHGSSEIAEMLLEKGALVGNIDRCSALVNICNTRKSRIDAHLAMRVMAEDHEEELRQYRDDAQNTMLHILVQRLAHRYIEHLNIDSESMVTCTAFLLKLGVDPTHQNISQQTVLDMLLFNLRSIVPGTLSDSIMPQKFEVVQAITRCVKLILPAFMDNLKCEYNPLLNISIASKNIGNYEVCMEYLKLFQLILNAELFPVDEVGSYGHTAWQYLLNGNALSCRKTMPCDICEPAVNLFCTAIHQGLDINQQVNLLGANESRFNQTKPITYAEIILRKLVTHTVHRVGMCSCITDPLTHEVEAPCDCCYLSLLDLFVQCGADVRNWMVKDQKRANGDFAMMLSSYTNKKHPIAKLTLVYRCIRSICWYVPGAKAATVPHFASMYDRLDDADEIAAVHELEELLQMTLSLKILCRICIMEHIQMKDVDKLSLPTMLKQFIRMGDYAGKCKVQIDI